MEISVRVEFLKKLHLFHGLSDIELTAVAELLKEQTVEKNSTVFTEGSTADSLHIIFQGKINLTHIVKNKSEKIATLSKGDYYGEHGLVRGKLRNATAIAEEESTLFILHRKNLIPLLKKILGLQKNIHSMLSSRALANKLRFTWLADNEIIYFLGRKHWFLLIRALILPVLCLPIIFGIGGLAFILNSAGVGLVAGFVLVLDLAWGFWQYIDWGNDYYIVTNQRIIWLEKVIAFYDSRTEAGLDAVLSVNRDTDYFGRLFEYGSVIVRTYTGQIRMNFVAHPSMAAAVIEEFLIRAKESGRKANEEAMKQAIRQKLGFTTAGTPQPAPEPAKALPKQPAKHPPQKSIWDTWWENAFRMRTDDGNVITYHKHIFGFIRDAFPYTAGVLVLFIGTILWPFLMDNYLPIWMLTIIFFGILVLLGFVIYKYMDWKNDIYQVTQDQIIDVSKKPLGAEIRRAAPLENILSTENTRNSLLGLLLNFGTVYIKIGGENFDFEDVADPPSVQQDIIRRQQGLAQKKKDKEIRAEQDRMTDWLAMYHRTLTEVEREKGPKQG